MNYFHLAVVFIFFSISFDVAGQIVGPVTTQDQTRIDARERQRTNGQFERLKGLRANEAKKNIPSMYPRPLTEKDKEAIALLPEDAVIYENFLKLEDTGFVRLHNRDNCNIDPRVLDTSSPCPANVMTRATNYSFRKKKYAPPIFADIELKTDGFNMTGVNTLGFLNNLGDITLESLTLQNPAIAAIVDFQPPDSANEVQKHFNSLTQGFKVGDFVYKRKLPMRENTVYVMRSIAYDGKVFIKNSRFKFNILDRDKRDDVIFVFRVIRQHEDGSVSLIWRELQRKEAPKLVFNK
jgi:hypothetical protein